MPRNYGYCNICGHDDRPERRCACFAAIVRRPGTPVRHRDQPDPGEGRGEREGDRPYR